MPNRLLALGLSLAMMSGATAVAAQAQNSGAGPAASAAVDAPAVIKLETPDGRSLDVHVRQAVQERGVIVFSHGWNSTPEAYSRIMDFWVENGFTVLSPLHTDSLQHPDHAAGNQQTFFITRIVDLAVVRGFAAQAHAGAPLIAAGHSFGSLNALMQAGAVTIAGPQGDPAVKAVVALSSPGQVPGLVGPDAFAAVDTPLLMVTGDADLVPGFVSDPADHRRAFDTSRAGDKMLLVFKGGDHSLVGNADAADFDLIAHTTVDFMAAYALGDAEAKARLAGLAAPDGVTMERR